MYAIIENGLVVNVVVWDGDASAWQPPDGTIAVPVPEGQVAYIGYGYDNGVFAQPHVSTN